MVAFGGRRLTRAGILFVVGILVLGGLVTGGIFLVKNHGEAVRRDQAVKIAEQNLKDNSKIATQSVNSGTPKADETKPGTAVTPETATQGTDAATDAAPATTAASTTELPVTGIDDLRIAGQAAIMALVVFSAISYVASRRASHQL